MAGPRVDDGPPGATVTVLGSIEVRRDGVDLTPGGALPLRLIAALTRHPERPVGTPELIEILWADGPPPAAASALRTQVARLRRALDGGISRSSQGYWITDPYTVDLFRWQGAMDAAGTTTVPQDEFHHLTVAIDLWGGRPWSDLADEPTWWAEAHGLEERARRAEDRWVELAAMLSPEHHLDRIAVLGRSAPIRTSRVRTLMRLLAQAGRPDEALDAYLLHRNAVAELFGTLPDPSVEQVHDDIVRGPSDVTTGRTGRADATTSPLGRGDAIDRLAAKAGRHRLVTVTGLGGIGKTTVARAWSARFRAMGRSVVWLSCPPTDGSHHLAIDLAQELGVRAASAAEATSAIRSRLVGVEHLVIDGGDDHDQVIPLLAHLLAHRPRLQITLTSRHPTGLGDESVLPLDPLPVPTPTGPLDGPAVELLHRAAERSGRPLSEADIREATTASGGIPLLLELLAQGPLEPGQFPTSVRSAVTETLEVLGTEATALAARIAVLPSGLSDEHLRWLERSVARPRHALRLLTWCGLVHRHRSSPGTPATMLDPIRRVIADVTPQADHLGYRRDTRAHLQGLGSAGRPSWSAPPAYDRLDPLDEEGLNLLAARSGANPDGPAEQVELVETLSTYLGLRGHANDLDEWLPPTQSVEDPVLRARAVLARARIGRFSSALVPLADDLEAAAQVLADAGDRTRALSAHLYLVLARCYGADVRAARGSLDRATPLLEQVTSWERAVAEVGLGFVALLEWDWPRASGHLAAAEAGFALDDPGGLAMSLYLRSILSLVGEGESQESLLDRATELAESVSDRPLVGLCRYAQIGLGGDARSVAAHERAARALEAGGLTEWAAQARMGAAALLLDGDTPHEAAGHVLAAVGPLRNSGAGGEAYALSGLAAALRVRAPDLAAELAWWAARPVDPTGTPLPAELAIKRDRWLGYTGTARAARRSVEELLMEVAQRLESPATGSAALG